MKKKLAAVLGVGAVLAVLASTAFAAVQVVFKAELNPAKRVSRPRWMCRSRPRSPGSPSRRS